MKLTTEQVEANIATVVDKIDSDAEGDVNAAKAAALALLGHGLMCLHVIATRLEALGGEPG